MPLGAPVLVPRQANTGRRHGLSLSLTSSAAIARQVDKLSRKIAGRSKSKIVLRYARDAAEAELELARIRQVKVALVERILALGVPKPAVPSVKYVRHLELVVVGKATLEEPMPSGEPERTAEALRRALPELIKLDRYEARAFGRRDNAIRQITRTRI